MIKKLRYITTFGIIMLLLATSDAYANDKLDKLISQMGFLSAPQEVLAENGIIVRLQSPILGRLMKVKSEEERCYTIRMGLLNVPHTATLNGLVVLIKNPTNRVFVVKWSESAISIGGFSGIPFLAGMKYVNAGNPSATPDTLVAPGQSISKQVYVSRLEYDDLMARFGNGWVVVGEPVYKDNTSNAVLTLKVVDDNGKMQYINLNSPPIGIVKQSNSTMVIK